MIEHDKTIDLYWLLLYFRLYKPHAQFRVTAHQEELGPDSSWL